MRSLSKDLKLTTGAAALAVAFNAGGADPQHPLFDTFYASRLSAAVAAAAPDDNPNLRVGGFVKNAFEEKLRQPLNRPQSVTYPNPVAEGQLAITAVVPPLSKYATASIPVCVEKGGRIVGTYSIKTNGDVVPDPWDGAGQPTGASSGFSAVCKPYIMNRGKAMMDAPNEASKPPPAVSQTPAPTGAAKPL